MRGIPPGGVGGREAVAAWSRTEGSSVDNERMFKGMCVHYGPGVPQNGICEVGVDVITLVGGPTRGWLRRTPCLARNRAIVECSERREPTYAELREWLAMVDRVEEDNEN